MSISTTGAVVRAVRKALGLRQADLALQAALSVVRLCRLERGLATWRPHEIERVADALGLPLRVLGVATTSGQRNDSVQAEQSNA